MTGFHFLSGELRIGGCPCLVAGKQLAYFLAASRLPKIPLHDPDAPAGIAAAVCQAQCGKSAYLGRTPNCTVGNRLKGRAVQRVVNAALIASVAPSLFPP